MRNIRDADKEIRKKDTDSVSRKGMLQEDYANRMVLEGDDPGTYTKV